MVTFNNAGRFGNWYFESCTAMAYALRHGLEFSMPIQKNDQFWNPIYCTHLQDPNYNPRLEEIRLWENGHHYQELPFVEEWRNKNIIIEGYRQSEKYFKDFRDEIIALMNYPYEKKDGYVCVHVRRGDYLHLRNKHPEVTKEWYDKAMDEFFGYTYKFFSDDINWCREQWGHRDDCEFSTNDHIERDFIEMQCCEHFVCSASTFAWAAMWHSRSKDKIVIFPKLWFVEGYPLNTDDIVPEWCIKM